MRLAGAHSLVFPNRVKFIPALQPAHQGRPVCVPAASAGAQAASVSTAAPPSLAQVCKELDGFLDRQDDSGLSGVTDILARYAAMSTVATSSGSTSGGEEDGGAAAGPSSSNSGAAVVLRAYGAVRQVPKRIYGLEELRLNSIQADKLLSPKDYSLTYTRNVAQAAAVAGFVALAWGTHMDAGQVLASLFGVTFLVVADQVANMGGGESLIVDTLGRLLKPSYAQRVAYHEAGHFLIAYLIGFMPRAYTLSSLDAFLRYKTLNIQAGTQFCDTAFLQETSKGRLSSTSLGKYACVALAGVVTEYLRFGEAEGGVGDIQQLDGLFRSLGFTQMKADSEVRWAVLNVASILRRHAALHDTLAGAMGRGASVGELVKLIETELADCDDI